MHIRQGRPLRISIYLSIPAMNATRIRADCGESACGLVEAKDVASDLSFGISFDLFDPRDTRRVTDPCNASKWLGAQP